MNAAACPPLDPTLRSVTAGFAVAVVASRVQRRDRRGAVERVAVGGAVELDRLTDDARARRPCAVSTCR